MREKVPDLIISKAVDIWCKKLFNPVYDNGDNSEHGAIGHMLATMNIQKDKSKITDLAGSVEKFRKVITAELIRLRDSPAKNEHFPSWLDVDYGPCKVLGDAADKAGIPPSLFSCKSAVLMRPRSIAAHFGYCGNYVYYYPLPNGGWLLTSITADAAEMVKIINSAMGSNPLGLLLED